MLRSHDRLHIHNDPFASKARGSGRYLALLFLPAVIFGADATLFSALAVVDGVLEWWKRWSAATLLRSMLKASLAGKISALSGVDVADKEPSDVAVMLITSIKMDLLGDLSLVLARAEAWTTSILMAWAAQTVPAIQATAQALLPLATAGLLLHPAPRREAAAVWRRLRGSEFGAKHRRSIASSLSGADSDGPAQDSAGPEVGAAFAATVRAHNGAEDGGGCAYAQLVEEYEHVLRCSRCTNQDYVRLAVHASAELTDLRPDGWQPRSAQRRWNFLAELGLPDSEVRRRVAREIPALEVLERRLGESALDLGLQQLEAAERHAIRDGVPPLKATQALAWYAAQVGPPSWPYVLQRILPATGVMDPPLHTAAYRAPRMPEILRRALVTRPAPEVVVNPHHPVMQERRAAALAADGWPHAVQYRALAAIERIRGGADEEGARSPPLALRMGNLWRYLTGVAGRRPIAAVAGVLDALRGYAIACVVAGQTRGAVGGVREVLSGTWILLRESQAAHALRTVGTGWIVGAVVFGSAALIVPLLAMYDVGPWWASMLRMWLAAATAGIGGLRASFLWRGGLRGAARRPQWAVGAFVAQPMAIAAAMLLLRVGFVALDVPGGGIRDAASTMWLAIKAGVRGTQGFLEELLPDALALAEAKESATATITAVAGTATAGTTTVAADALSGVALSTILLVSSIPLLAVLLAGSLMLPAAHTSVKGDGSAARGHVAALLASQARFLGVAVLLGALWVTGVSGARWGAAMACGVTVGALEVRQWPRLGPAAWRQVASGWRREARAEAGPGGV
ncbi:unnamed protein product [Pedinophyceae sp. YPF-701]|nr:unnamed protein product [Pedinophyceae sp. YPF-701]